MRGMSEALWELGKCHSPTLGVAEEQGEIAEHSLRSPCLLERHGALNSVHFCSAGYTTVPPDGVTDLSDLQH